VSFPQRFRPPTNIARYAEETNPGIWLEDFRLTYQAEGVDDDHFIIQYLSIYMREHVRAWLEFLLPDSICDWVDLKRFFVGNFQGTYVHPRNSWDVKSYQQEPNESLWDYIYRFSK